MFVLGVRLSQYCNGVSELHGGVARRMWTHVWPNRSDEEVPITHITNGVHVSSWVSYEFSLLFERYLGPDWALNPFKPELVRRIEPEYPPLAVKAHIQGVVIMEAIVNEEGAVQNVRLLRSANPLLDREAEIALKQWRYSPLVLNGIRVPFILTVTLSFHLEPLS